MLKKIFKYLSIFLLLIFVVYFLFFSKKYPITLITHSFTPGDSLDSYHGVTVYNNGATYEKSYGKNYCADSFYCGKKWQCVEFVRRYYHEYMKYDFKDGSGNAKDFFDQKLKQGELNKRRGMLQFINGMNEKPMRNDILVFDSQFGHVTIVINVTDDEVEVVQQNIFMTPRQSFVLKYDKGNYIVGEGRKPMGWLRKP